MRIAVLGAGAWGTALAISLCARHQVRLWVRDKAQSELLALSRINRRHLDHCVLPASILVENDLGETIEDAELLIAAIPVSALRNMLKLVNSFGKSYPLVWVCKGFEAETSKLPHEVAAEEYDGPCAVLSGPSFAREVAQGLPTAVTLASFDRDFVRDMSALLHGSRLRVYSSCDMIGVEVGGAVKNVMAIASGISDGLGLGLNARAALITRGLAEITRLGLKLGGKMETFLGLSGVGDLTLTCTGELSRNRKVGMLLAHGRALPDILESLGATAEGVYTAKETLNLSKKFDIEMPITKAVCDVLYGGVLAKDAVEELLKRDSKPEC